MVSTWSQDVCTGAARLDADAAAALAALIVDGLADAAAPRPAPARSALPDTRPGLVGLVDRLRWLVRGASPAPTATAADASVTPLRRHTV